MAMLSTLILGRNENLIIIEPCIDIGLVKIIIDLTARKRESA